MTWLRSSAPGETPLDQTFGLRPNAYARFCELIDGLPNGGVDTETLDACAARIDALLLLDPDPTAGLALTPAQRAAVAFAEQYALDPHGLRDSNFVALHDHFTDAQLATLTLAVAMFDARARIATALDV